MRPKQIRELIDIAIENPDTTPPIFEWGAPGCGKSAIPKQAARDAHIGFVDNRPPLRDPTDVRGIPTVVEGNAVWLPPSDLPTPWFCLTCNRVLQARQIDYKDGTDKCRFCGQSNITDRGIIIHDELPAAPPMTQAAYYQLILDRAVGEYRLPKGWYQIAAGNRIEDRAVTYRVSSALSNRFTHVDYDVNLDDWTEWALTEGRIESNIIAYHKYRGGDFLFKFNPESSEKAFCSPRSWEMASKWIKSRLSRSLLVDTLEGTVGKGATAEFVAFLKVQTELPDLTPILEGKNSYVPPHNRIDLKYAIVSALATRASTDHHYDNLIKYSDKLPEEFSVLLISMLISKNEQSVIISPSFPGWAKDHSDVIMTQKRKMI